MQASDADMIWQSVCTRTNDIIQFGGSNTLCAAAATDTGLYQNLHIFTTNGSRDSTSKGGAQCS